MNKFDSNAAYELTPDPDTDPGGGGDTGEEASPPVRLEMLALQIDAVLEELLPQSGIGILDEALRYALGLDTQERRFRGKRLRPVMCLVVAESLGAPRRAAQRFAAAMELVHNFMLVHDDIQDGDVQRRHRPAVWARYGVDHAITVGNYLHAMAIDTVAHLTEHGCSAATTTRLMRLLTQTLLRTGEGQVLDVQTRQVEAVSPETYLDLVTRKTGDYMAAPLVGGALLAEADDRICTALLEYGRGLGRVFQVADDMIDLTAAKGRGEIGGDIAEGKRSWPVLYVASLCTPDERAELFRVLDLARAETSEEGKQRVLSLYRRYDVHDGARAEIRRLTGQALQHLAAVPPKTAAILTEMARMVAGRTA